MNISAREWKHFLAIFIKIIKIIKIIKLLHRRLKNHRIR